MFVRYFTQTGTLPGYSEVIVVASAVIEFLCFYLFSRFARFARKYT